MVKGFGKGQNFERDPQRPLQRPLKGLWLTKAFTLWANTGTMYLEREGWVFLEDSKWGDKLAQLGEQDHYLRTLTHWGDQQLVPKWEKPMKRTCFSGKLVDSRNRVGVTCMLLDRAGDSEEAPTATAHRISMCNVPPYIFAQTVKSATIYVGNDSKYRVVRRQVEFIILWKCVLTQWVFGNQVQQAAGHKQNIGDSYEEYLRRNMFSEL
ncbi:hypothetical protein B0H16DRAFT_1695322 [Mycena metata]|uniref:Uncharacterized protein n=1 Tax=Mycena metata TaxID=1033252 RepID=A0AAD7MXS0_9AGAR|nr:hypothetical protein B0H16DRAFT_1695322 [Mycena metata]